MICATSGVSQGAPIVYLWHIKENMRRTLKNKIIAESKSMRNINNDIIISQCNKVRWQW